MITNLILLSTYNLLTWLIGLLPTSNGFSSQITSAFSTMGGYVNLLEPLISISTLLTCVGFIFGIEIAIWGFHATLWILSHTKIINTTQK